MGFTIEDMLVVSKDRYQMKMIAGGDGWSNSISWMLMVEDFMILRNFTGKEFAITTGLGFDTEEKLLQLAGELSTRHASGLLVNTGFYITEIPKSVIDFCNENDLPLLTVPWEIYLSELIKDLSIRIFLQGSTDEQIASALIHAIENPKSRDHYIDVLRPYFDIDGIFQVVLMTNGMLDKMDTVERKRLSYRLQLYLTNLTHNATFFYYDSYFVLVANALPEEVMNEVLRQFNNRVRRKMPDVDYAIGVSSRITDISNLHLAYTRAKAAVTMAHSQKMPMLYFDNMGVYRLLYSINDTALLREVGDGLLAPLLDYDNNHSSGYVATLESYLKNNGSIQAVSEELFTHRNTILYRMNNIKKLLGTDLESASEKIQYQLACMIRHM